MNDIFEAFQQLLRSSNPDYSQFRRGLVESQSSLQDKNLVRSQVLMRLCLALEGFEEGRTGTSDVSVLLRQTIRVYERRLEVKRSLWQVLSSRELAFGLRSTQERPPDVVELVADDWHPTWLPGGSHIDELVARRYDKPAIADGLLYAMTDGEFAMYQSEAQKAAVQACLFAPAGSTLLVTLPTGGGKSMCTQLPAWQESSGGQIKGGTTLVIVPTVSLALDQEVRVQRYFVNAPSMEYKPNSLTGATPEIVRSTIRSGLLNGTLPLLYTSPEALMNSRLYDICLEAASRGSINRLVIDEAHLVETWGAGFRTEFQFLSAYRKKLLEASRGQLRTLLLSATVTKKCEELLKKLFGSQGLFYSVRADRLRPEISYWFSYAESEAVRQERVLEALRHLPRPAILYVTSPDDTKQWLTLLREQGFERIAAFSGETDADERLRLIREWNNNQRDVMVATSAFGVGVDKSDVRSVLHACLPENIDRFYQEVGRAGRDGYSAISLMCVTAADHEKARSMTRAARITTEKAISRWEGMYMTRRFFSDRGDVILLDVNATPSANLEMYKGTSNREWNEHTLLLMQRAGLISIMDTRNEATLPEENLSTPGISSNWIQIQLCQPSVTAHPRDIQFTMKLDAKRQQEAEEVRKTLKKMAETMVSFALSTATRCIARTFVEVYAQSALACGGCPVCRREQRQPYANPFPLEINFTSAASQAHFVSSSFVEKIGSRYRINVLLDEPCDIATLRELIPLLTGLVGVGFQQLVLPAPLLKDMVWTHTLVASLAEYTRIPHTIFPDTWITSSEPEERPIFPVPTVVVYPLQDEDADQFHRVFRQRQATQLQDVPIITIVQRSLMLASENGKYVERINGLSHSVDSLRSTLENAQELIF